MCWQQTRRVCFAHHEYKIYEMRDDCFIAMDKRSYQVIILSILEIKYSRISYAIILIMCCSRHQYGDNIMMTIL